MKVTSGKFQYGDVVIWKSGSKQIIDDDNGLYPNTRYGNQAIETMLKKLPNIRCIKRKTKERELGPNEILQKGDIIIWSDYGNTSIVEGLVGEKVSFLASYPETKAYRYFNPTRISRREYKRRVEAAQEWARRLSSMSEQTSEIISGLIDILEGKR